MNSSFSNKSPSIRGLGRFRDLWIVLGLIAAAGVIYISHAREPKEYSLWDQAIVSMSAPVQRGVVAALDGMAQVWHGYIALIDVRKDNERLKDEMARLSENHLALTERIHQLEHVQALIEVQQSVPPEQRVHAEIIAASPSPLFRSVRINRGRDDGLRLGAAVLSHEGVVGRVAALGRTSSDVMLLIDANSSADVLVQRTRARARVRGRGADRDFSLDAEYLGRVADVEPGDLLVTGGLGRTFPKGLPVGRVMGIERRAFGLYQRAIVEPTVNFARLEHVLVVVPGPDAAID